MTQPSPGPELQRDVQRLLGRCLLRLQQYERQMKVLLTHHEIGGTVETMQIRLESQREKYAGKSLGQLVKDLFESYVVVDGAERPLLDEKSAPSDRISMAFRFQIRMSEERRGEVMAAIKELVDMRNDLVHHLTERFDVWTVEGCLAAAAHLNACYERIDGHVKELQHWSIQLAEAASHMASLAKGGALENALVNGIAPDGSFEWPQTGIVQALRGAPQPNETDGWIRLDDAKVWITQHHPEQTPERYGCRSWPQVLHESRCFRLEYRSGEDGRKRAWYRDYRAATKEE
jgi:OST-HTH/LOTUS domain